MFEKNLSAMVRGLREHPNSAEYMSITLAEIKAELASPNANIKTNAFLKLGYLSMLGADMTMAHMPIIEVMSSQVFTLKRPAMFVASLAFKPSTCSGASSGVTLLTTNIFIKELASPNYLEVGMALSSLSSICTQDIAEGVVNAMLPLTAHSKPYVRKKVALAFFKICQTAPSCFVSVFPKLKELLSDSDQSVQTAAVSAFLEIGKRNTKLLLPTIPILFHLLKEARNNWLLIKLLKSVEFLSLIEPRLWRKLVGTGVLRELIGATKAKSVQVEFTRFVLRVGAKDADTDDDEPLIESAFVLLEEFISSTDPNLRSIAVSILVDMLTRLPPGDGPMRTVLEAHKSTVFDQVIRSIDSSDSTIRRASLTACALLADTPDAATHVVQQLLALFAKFEGKPSVQLDLVKAVLRIGSNFDSLIPDTEWYLRILVLLGSDPCVDAATAAVIAAQFRQIAAIRDAGVCMSISIAALARPQLPPPLVAACAWTIGEYTHSNWEQTLPRTTETCAELMSKLFEKSEAKPTTVNAQIDCVWAAVKVFAAFLLNEGRSAEGSAILRSELTSRLEGTMNQLTVASIALNEVCSLALGTVAWTESPKVTNEEIEDVLFKRDDSQEPIHTPANLDEPFIELPKHLKAELSLATAWGLPEGCQELYTDTEEDGKPAAVREGGNLFSFESILSK